MTNSGKELGSLFIRVGGISLGIFACIVAGLLVLDAFVWNEKPASPTVRTSVVGTNEGNHEINVHGQLLKIGMTSDDVFAIVTHSDETGKPYSFPDPTDPESLIVKHEYRVDGRSFALWFMRIRHDGPYVLSKIEQHSTL